MSAQEPDNESIAAAIASLADRDLDVRRRALSSLAGVGAPAVPALIDALRSGRGNVPRWAANALRKIGAAAVDAVPALVEALEGDPKLAKAALRALRGIGGAADGAVPALVARLDDPDARHWALMALVAIRPDVELTVAQVVEGLAHRRYEVRGWAEKRLGAGGDDAIAALTAALEDERVRLRESAAQLLAALGR